ncbi:TerC family protein [Rouxiella badensis]|jgi:YjbE family integral membrane protein|uniref:Tellurium resistance protein TerC n=1 Tax=Rouxiella badensis TaxID=1646377 RepID=A0A1X0WAD8_9GAMM|nr:TerC family protein [Rouxiella badensis]MCC3704309.1 TerC family protein [Rouxiella badensis]MCC3720792.1 TerC family protein [Rouxiella badensis]MCC3730631.1 TerC family protein [Rouxiella badensis]MCC3734874.1 TerC family protein [Rouxiella badensis]MCC3741871.1 TerC family protein [Rouxiella badensis]
MTWLFEQWDFIVILLQIIVIDLLLGGDNAVVIAMACRKLPPHQRNKAIFIGTAGAILARVVLLIIAVSLLNLPYLKLVGGLLLLWIGIKLVANEDEESDVKSATSLWKTAMTIVVADVVMSLDNVLAVAAAGKGNILLVALGVVISIPIIIAGSKLVLAIINRFPVVIMLGGALIGWIAGSMLVTDPAIAHLQIAAIAHLPTIAGVVGALLVLALGLGKGKLDAKKSH